MRMERQKVQNVLSFAMLILQKVFRGKNPVTSSSEQGLEHECNLLSVLGENAESIETSLEGEI